MKHLFLICAYHSKSNSWTRLLTTSDSSDYEDARKQVLDDFAEGYPGHSRIDARYVCETRDDVYMEV